MERYGTPPAEVAIDTALVRELVGSQFPDLSHLPIRPAPSGWDNAMFRLGASLAVRLPRRAAAVPALLNEQRWLGTATGAVEIPVPIPQRCGGPAPSYPWAWSVVPWFPGRPADEGPVHHGQAGRLGAFLNRLHQAAPRAAPVNPHRGVPLAARAGDVGMRLDRALDGEPALHAAVRAIWQEALAAPVDLTPRWIHGDLHPRNILLADGALSAVIDWGDLGAGDPAVDLAAFWMLFDDAAARRAGLAAYGGISAATRARAQGWAVFFGVTLLLAGAADDARHARTGAATLRRLASSAVADA